MDPIELDPALLAAPQCIEQIPVIDFAPFLTGDAPARAKVAAQIGLACREIGFFYLVNHGVKPALVARVYAEAARFFRQEAAAKAEIAIENSPHHRGYFRVGGENLDPVRQKADGDLKEGIKIGRDLASDHPLVRANTPLHGPNQWPRNLPGFQATMQEYYAVMEALGRQAMRAMALSLGLAETWFDAWLTTPMTTLGPLRYPPQGGRITEARLGAGAHSDFGCLTLLSQDAAGGLQVQARDGRWLDAPPVAGSFVVNIGDMMERWTNGVFTSTLHRVINISGGERFSLPFFFDPDFHAQITCLPTCLAPGEVAKYAPTTAGLHLLEKIAASFAYHNEKPT